MCEGYTAYHEGSRFKYIRLYKSVAIRSDRWRSELIESEDYRLDTRTIQYDQGHLTEDTNIKNKVFYYENLEHFQVLTSAFTNCLAVSKVFWKFESLNFSVFTSASYIYQI